MTLSQLGPPSQDTRDKQQTFISHGSEAQATAQRSLKRRRQQIGTEPIGEYPKSQVNKIFKGRVVLSIKSCTTAQVRL